MTCYEFAEILKEEAYKGIARDEVRTFVVVKLLSKTNHSIQEIAEFVDTSVDFVIDVKNKLERAMEEARKKVRKQGIEEGIKEGIEKAKSSVASNLLLKTNYSLQEIAEITNSSIDFVIDVKSKLAVAEK
jgi:transposase